MNVLFSYRKHIFIALVIAILALYFVPLGSHALLEPDEGRYSEIPREMIETGDYVTPMLNYVKYFEKPVLLYWMNAGSFAVFGQNEFAARFATAVCAVLGALVTGMLGAYIYGSLAGLLAGVITALSLLYFAVGTINITDMPLSFFITLAMASFYVGHIERNRLWYLVFYAAMALGLLTKGLVAVVLPGGIIFWYIIFTHKWRIIIEALYLPGILLFFLISAPWFWLVCRANSDFFHFFFIQEHFLRYATKMHNRYEPFWFFLPMIPAGLMPWTAFLFSLFGSDSVVRSPYHFEKRDANTYLLLWFGVILLFFSLSSSKLIPYIVPCIPPLAILMGADIARMVDNERWHGGAVAWMFGIALVFSAALIGYAFIGKELPMEQTLPIALKVSGGLLFGPLAAMWFSAPRRNNFSVAVVALCLSSLLFIFGLQGIYKIMGETRSMKAVSEVIIKEQQPDETIAAYGEILQGIPFYTKQRVLLVDEKGELDFGSKHEEGKGWFPTSTDFLPEWKDGSRPLILVIEKERIKSLFPDGKAGETKRIDAGEYAVLFNRRVK
ncbi:MAG: glycosyltransferase family 39 protein [Synergistaceae bacterium]|nr:glycosyltransferase family 39 protein [Synergistaceae bacterium]